MTSELKSVYSKESDPPLMYSDLQTHLGNFVVIHDEKDIDKDYFLIQVMEEFEDTVII
jgi:hypothetical protein